MNGNKLLNFSQFQSKLVCTYVIIILQRSNIPAAPPVAHPYQQAMCHIFKVPTSQFKPMLCHLSLSAAKNTIEKKQQKQELSLTGLGVSPADGLSLCRSLTSKGERDQKNAAAMREGRERGTLPVKGKQAGGRAQQDRASRRRGVIMPHGAEG